MTELIKKILKGLGVVVGVWLVLAIVFVSLLPESEKTKVTVAIQEESKTDIEESKVETPKKEAATTDETSIEEPSIEKTDFITKAKDKINEIKENHEKKEAEKNNPRNKEEILKLARKCRFNPSKKNINRLKQYDKDLVIERLNGFLSYSATNNEVSNISAAGAESVVTIYVKAYGETEATKKLQKAIDKCNKLEKKCPSDSELKKIKHDIEFKTECIEKSSWKTFYLYKREDADDVDWGFLTWGDSIYYAQAEDGSVAAVLSNETYTSEGEYNILCRVVQETGLTGIDPAGFETNDVPVYADELYHKEEIKELQSKVDLEKQLTKAKKQLIKLMEKGL